MSAAGAPLRLGLAGCGRIAERYLAAVQDLPGVAFVAVADPDADRAARAALAAGGAAAHANAGELVAAGGVDALVVATPVGQHEEAARVAAETGLPSLVEKPPAPDLAGAVALAALEPLPAIGFNRRLLQGAELASLVPASGWLELELELSFRRGGWGAHVSHDEALLDAGTHLIDLAAFLTGSAPIAVRDAAIAPESAYLELELGRARARVHCSTDRRYAERVEIRDRGGRAIAISRTGGLRAAIARLGGGEDRLVHSLRRQLELFAAKLRGEDPGALADADAAVAAMSVVDAARRSAELGGAEVTVVPLSDTAGLVAAL